MKLLLEDLAKYRLTVKNLRKKLRRVTEEQQSAPGEDLEEIHPEDWEDGDIEEVVLQSKP
jgi:hypothetical protein